MCACACVFLGGGIIVVRLASLSGSYYCFFWGLFCSSVVLTRDSSARAKKNDALKRSGRTMEKGVLLNLTPKKFVMISLATLLGQSPRKLFL